MITHEQAFKLARELPFLNPNYTRSEGTATYLLVELIEVENDNSLDVSSCVIDPTMPDQGGADEYLALKPIQRLVLELATILDYVMPPMREVTQKGPLEEKIWDKAQNNKLNVCKLLRHLSIKAAAVGLEKEL